MSLTLAVEGRDLNQLPVKFIIGREREREGRDREGVESGRRGTGSWILVEMMIMDDNGS